MASSASSNVSMGRQRLRLIAALGLLAGVALAAGGLASLAEHRSAPRPSPAGTASLPLPPPPMPSAAARLERQVERAETSMAEARRALRRARTLGLVDQPTLEALELRLERLGESSLERVRRSYGPAPEPTMQGRLPLRSIGDPSRDL